MKSEANNEYHSVQDDLKAWIDNELSPWRQFRVRRHLARCASCREEVQAMEQLHQDLRAGSPAETALPPALRARILTQLGEAADRTPLPAEPARPWLRRYGLAASLAVNATLIVVLVYAGVLRETRTETAPPVAITRAATAPAAPRVQNRPAVAIKKALPLPAAPRSPAPSAHVAAGKLATTSSRAVPPAAPRQAPPMPVTVPDFSTAVPPAPARATPPLLSNNGSAALVRPLESAAKPVSRMRTKTVESPALRLNTVPASMPPVAAIPAPPPGALSRGGIGGGGGFGGGGAFDGGGFGGAEKPAPLPQEVTPLASAGAGSVRLAAPAAPAGRPEAPKKTRSAGPEMNVLSVSDGATAGIKPADRATPMPVGPWPSVALPPGVDPNALGVKTVTVTWDVDEHGRVFHVVFKPTGAPEVDGAIRAAVHGARYLPATRHNEPVKARVAHTFVLAPPPAP